MVSQPNPEAGLQQVGAEIAAWQQGTTTSDASGYSCPQCGGGIWQATEGPLVRFHCHTGHVYSPESFANDQAEALETALWQAVRLLGERAVLLRQFAGGTAGSAPATAARYSEQAEELEQGGSLLRELLQRNGTRLLLGA